MKYVLRRRTDQQFKTDVSRWSNRPRWTVDVNNARVYKRRCDATQSLHGEYPTHLIEIVPVKLVELKRSI